MEEQLISFETAKLAKGRGFKKEWCSIAYKEDKKLYMDTGLYTNYPAPTQSLLQKWLREKHRIYVIPLFDEPYGWTIGINSKTVKFNLNLFFNTYEEALEKGLQESLKLIEKE